MRLNSISLEWFRGAAERVSLEVGGKSAVVYGANGAGKSSFVDAVEYIVNNGKIGHLSHEYSGKKQERGVINTHKPPLTPAHASLEFANGTVIGVEVQTNGAWTVSGNGVRELKAWGYRRVVLRQDEVAHFVSSPKGDKYSALLPLLGLEPLELAAENTRQLAKAVEKTTEIVVKREQLRLATESAQTFFKGKKEVLIELRELHARYLPDDEEKASQAEECAAILSAIVRRVESLSADGRSYEALSSLAAIDLSKAVADVRTAAVALAKSSETLLQERLAVLENALLCIAKSESATDVSCPACGRTIGAADLRAHLEAETEKLELAGTLLATYRATSGRLADEVARFKEGYRRKEVGAWSLARSAEGHRLIENFLETLEPDVLRRGAGEPDLRGIESHLLPIVPAAVASTKIPPQEARALLTDREMVVAAAAVIEAVGLSLTVERIDGLLECLVATEAGVRDQIRARSDDIIATISGDIQRMWAVLHPNEAIEGVRLSHPDDTEKAIDIELTFFGVEQKSPRLTLSEGNRNSLGLCVFLSMAKRDANDAPVILDDVVVSLDRNHRGMVAVLLEQEFADRQVLIFTHDRDWYIELRQQLEAKDWRCSTLRPYTSPSDGISWSAKSWGFDDARAFLKDSPDSAGNTARKIMDVELAARTEKLNVRLPYMHGFRNDHRTGHDFLDFLIPASEKAFQRREGTEYESSKKASEALIAADKLLVSWGNRASHSFDLTPGEATHFIDVCEAALAAFDCDECGKPVYKLDDGNGIMQCGCGAIRWRYGKL